ncbi:DMT family transporter [Chengkuizengella axinellae]|uniref:DMT family transporter n=1 Tax=Chengkuizengella axinellae TaxID=3064388 RepID=UPI0035274515
MKQSVFVYFCAILYVFITGLSYLFTKVALEITDPVDTLAHRFTFSFIAILIPIFSNKIKIQINMQRMKKLLPLVIVYPVTFLVFLTFGLEFATSSEGAILQASAPIFTMILASVFLKERTNFLQKSSIILSVIGVAFIFIMKGTGVQFNSLTGIILLLLAAVIFAGYSILSRFLSKDFKPSEITFFMLAGGFISFNFVAIVKHLMDGSIRSLFAPVMDIEYFSLMIYLGILSTLVAALLVNYVLSKLDAAKVMVFANLSPVISIIAGAIFLGESIFYYHIIGTIMIIAGVLGTNVFSKKKITFRTKKRVLNKSVGSSS